MATIETEPIRMKYESRIAALKAENAELEQERRRQIDVICDLHGRLGGLPSGRLTAEVEKYKAAGQEVTRWHQEKSLECSELEAKNERLKEELWVEQIVRASPHRSDRWAKAWKTVAKACREKCCWWGREVDELRAEVELLRELMKRLKLECDSVVCECGERFSDTDLADIVNVALEAAHEASGGVG